MGSIWLLETEKETWGDLELPLLNLKLTLLYYYCICIYRIYDLQFMDKIYEEVAHDSEILNLAYSREMDG